MCHKLHTFSRTLIIQKPFASCVFFAPLRYKKGHPIFFKTKIIALNLSALKRSYFVSTKRVFFS